MDFNFKEIFQFGFIDSFKQKGALKYFIFWSIFLIVLNILESFVVNLVFAPALSNPNVSSDSVVFLAIYAAIFLFVFGLISSILSIFMSYFILALALKSKGKKAEQFSILRGIELFVLELLSFFASLFSVFKLKFLAVPIVGVGLVIIAFILFLISSKMSSAYAGGEYLFAMIVVLFGALLVLVALILFFVYVVIIFYNLLRLSMAQLLFVEEKKGMVVCLKESWEITCGKVLPIFFVLLVIGVAVGLAGSVVSIPLNVYMGNFNSVTQVASFSKVIQLLVDPIVIILSIPSILLQVAAVFIQAFSLVSIYSYLSTFAKVKIETNSFVGKGVENKSSLPRRKLKKRK